ncbi:DgyrCDS12908 [Dimorphilus gyrociliatus]|uniref:DgyrCDS12908 n=1 Tax=Dimorphilus gyrociliatus TaxID=2664684 RepID=A0A7I8W966_9ANNE|nr:DgyrCDS12908 [Dimorphilus gyrociliatus]
MKIDTISQNFCDTKECTRDDMTVEECQRQGGSLVHLDGLKYCYKIVTKIPSSCNNQRDFCANLGKEWSKSIVAEFCHQPHGELLKNLSSFGGSFWTNIVADDQNSIWTNWSMFLLAEGTKKLFQQGCYGDSSIISDLDVRSPLISLYINEKSCSEICSKYPVSSNGRVTDPQLINARLNVEMDRIAEETVIILSIPITIVAGFYYHDTPVDWYEANYRCLSSNSRLPSFINCNEKAKVKNVLPSNTEIWIDAVKQKWKCKCQSDYYVGGQCEWDVCQPEIDNFKKCVILENGKCKTAECTELNNILCLVEICDPNSLICSYERKNKDQKSSYFQTAIALIVILAFIAISLTTLFILYYRAARGLWTWKFLSRLTRKLGDSQVSSIHFDIKKSKEQEEGEEGEEGEEVEEEQGKERNDDDEEEEGEIGRGKERKNIKAPSVN